MRKINIRTVAAAAVAATVMLFTLVACKGRTMENMEPTGETIEVDVEEAVDTIAGIVIDSAPAT